MIVVVIPCYRVKNQVLSLLEKIPPLINRILIIDDACPLKSGEYVQTYCNDSRVEVIFHTMNQGVGGAMITGYKRALELKAKIVIKLDGDGQMDPSLLPRFISPLVSGNADYTKGNRFYRLESLKSMPKIRLFGNAVLSFITKISSGYWHIMDPTNGYTAIHSSALKLIPLDKLEKRYFFESDLLFRLNTVRAVVRDVPMDASYQDEESSLKIHRVSLEFPLKHLRCFWKRIFYSYFLRDFNSASLAGFFGSILVIFGVIYGSSQWWKATQISHTPAAPGVVMMAALPLILGIQFLLSFVQFDIGNVPKDVIQKQFVDIDHV